MTHSNLLSLLVGAVLVLGTTLSAIYASEILTRRDNTHQVSARVSDVIQEKIKSQEPINQTVDTYSTGQLHTDEVAKILDSTLTEDQRKQVQNFDIYLNETLPNFELIYPSSWNFDTFTQQNGSQKLTKRVITLTKDTYELTIITDPQPIFSCLHGIDLDGDYNFDSRFELSGGYHEYYLHQPEDFELYGLYYSKDSKCFDGNIIESTINVNDLDTQDNVNNFSPNQTTVDFYLRIETNLNPDSPADILYEVRSIINNSTFK